MSKNLPLNIPKMAEKFWIIPFSLSAGASGSVFDLTGIFCLKCCVEISFCTVHLPEGCSAVFNPAELSWLLQPFWVWKIAKVAVPGSAAGIWGLEGKCDAFGEELNQKLENWHFSLSLFSFFYRMLFIFLNQWAEITAIYFLLQNLCTWGFFQWCWCDT